MIIKGNVVITGANRGIGLSLVKCLASLDTVDKVFAACRTPESAMDLLKLQKSNPKIKIIKIDVQNDLSIHLAAEQLSYELEGSGGINCLVNNAGILEMSGSSFETPNRSSFWRHFDVNTVGAVITTRLFIPLLRKAAIQNTPSLVLNVSSSAASISKLPSHSISPSSNIVYGMAKAALNHFTATLASMERQNNIFVASLAPSWTKTGVGGSHAPMMPDKSAKLLIDVVYHLRPNDSGKMFDSSGKLIPF